MRYQADITTHCNVECFCCASGGMPPAAEAPAVLDNFPGGRA